MKVFARCIEIIRNCIEVAEFLSAIWQLMYFWLVALFILINIWYISWEIIELFITFITLHKFLEIAEVVTTFTYQL